MDILKPRLMWINDRCYRVCGDEGDFVPDEDDLRGYGDTADTFRSDSRTYSFFQLCGYVNIVQFLLWISL